jgi:hypothetical protein
MMPALLLSPRARRAAAATVLAGFSSCALDLERAAPEVARFALVAERPVVAAVPDAQASARLDVRPFHPVQPAASGQFVYRVGDAQFVTDFYRGYVARPELLITHAARAWLAAAGTVGTVLPVASRSIPTHVLEADLVELHVDFRDPGRPQAVAALRYALLSEGGTVVRTGTVRGLAAIDMAAESRQDRGVADAQSASLAALLTALETEVAAAIAGSD